MTSSAFFPPRSEPQLPRFNFYILNNCIERRILFAYFKHKSLGMFVVLSLAGTLTTTIVTVTFYIREMLSSVLFLTGWSTSNIRAIRTILSSCCSPTSSLSSPTCLSNYSCLVHQKSLFL